MVTYHDRRRVSRWESPVGGFVGALCHDGGMSESTSDATRGSLYEFAGGSAAIGALAAAHHERCVVEPEISHAFSHGTDPDHVAHLAAYLSEVFGGPDIYSRQLGGQPYMIGLHCGNGIPDGWAERFTACFVAAIEDAGLPSDPEFRAALRAYMEWATADVHRRSAEGAGSPHDLRMPRWSWSGLVGES